MHIILISACEKRALKKTRAILDSYAIRTGHSSWQAPMTQEGLVEIRQAIKKVATRQTAVAAYINFGMRRMKLAWVVGAKHKFSDGGAYPVASTKKQQKQLMVEPWTRASSLLAGAAGDMHDIGKASQHFQNKLDPKNAGQPIRDDVRHEWLSAKLLQQLRHNGWDWQQAWQNLSKGLDKLTLGDRIVDNGHPLGLQNVLEAVDYLVLSHHGLFGSEEEMNPPLPNYFNHVRKVLPCDAQLACAGELDDSIFISHQKRMQRLDALVPNYNKAEQNLLYWKALALHSRAALIHADHTISAQRYMVSEKDTKTKLFANTKIQKIEAKGKETWQRVQDQPLIWHLHQVGDRAAYIATKMMTDMNFAGLSEQSVERICTPTQHPKFQWQNTAGNALHKQRQKAPDAPALIFNIAGTGSGKTRMNIRAACTLRPDDPRISIALNLRSLTLQTGEALKTSMQLSEDEMAVIIGDTVTQQLFDQSKKDLASKAEFIDSDENQAEPQFYAQWGEDNQLPAWLIPLFSREEKGQQKLQTQDATILGSPLLVSTIDYLIAAGEPHRQGHHVKALLRVMSSDLILDEVDGYDPKALIAVLRLVQLAALYGRNVICSSATLSLAVAETIHSAFVSGLQMRAALYEQPQQSMLAIIDNALAPKVWLEQSDQPSEFTNYYQQHLQALQQHLSEQPYYRLAQLMPLPETTVLAWQQAVLAAAQQLHSTHAWQFNNSGKSLSIGLIRVANIRHAIRLAQFLAQHWQEANIACYHANDWLISRFYKEQRLDQLLSRHQDGRKRKTGNEAIEQDAEMIALMANTEASSVPFIVVATPVEEVGRDHDFDWAVIDASSVQSIVQTAGRVNRHRMNRIEQPNIIIPQWNHRYCHNRDRERQKGNARQRTPVFIWPGYEGYNSGNVQYRSQDLHKLLPWDEHSQLVIDARLRFDQQSCLFAQQDDQQIAGFCEMYFDTQNTDPEKALFSNSNVDAGLMTERIYQQTPLRDRQYQEVYKFKYDDDLVIAKYTYMFDEKRSTKHYAVYGWGWKAVHFDTIEPVPQAWLALSPQQMFALCQQYKIDDERGCSIQLTRYSQDHDPDWCYDYSFGVFQKTS